MGHEIVGRMDETRILGRLDEAAVQIQIAAGQRKRVDVRGIDDLELVRAVRAGGDRREALANLIDEIFDRTIIENGKLALRLD